MDGSGRPRWRACPAPRRRATTTSLDGTASFRCAPSHGHERILRADPDKVEPSTEQCCGYAVHQCVCTIDAPAFARRHARNLKNLVFRRRWRTRGLGARVSSWIMRIDLSFQLFRSQSFLRWLRPTLLRQGGFPRTQCTVSGLSLGTPGAVSSLEP